MPNTDTRGYNMKTYSHSIHIKKNNWVALRFEFDKNVIERIKRIDCSLRDYDEKAKVWGVEAKTFEEHKFKIFPKRSWKSTSYKTQTLYENRKFYAPYPSPISFK